MVITVNVNIPSIDNLAAAMGVLATALSRQTDVPQLAGSKPDQTAQTVTPEQQPVQQQITQQSVPLQQSVPVQQATPQPVQQPLPIQQPAQPSTPQTVPTTTQTYTMDQLAVAATSLLDSGKRNEVIGLLNSFGVASLTALPKEQYGAFATQIRALGAKI